MVKPQLVIMEPEHFTVGVSFVIETDFQYFGIQLELGFISIFVGIANGDLRA
jgi:hypothetical protein